MGGPCFCSYDRSTLRGPMKLVVAIVADEDSAALLADLTATGYQATQIPADHAFLRRGSSLVLSGVDASLVDGVLEVIRRRCRTRRWPPRATAVPIESESPPSANETVVGGATIFVTDVARHERL